MTDLEEVTTGVTGRIRLAVFGIGKTRLSRGIDASVAGGAPERQTMLRITEGFCLGYNTTVAIKNLADLRPIALAAGPFVAPFIVEGCAMGLGPRLLTSGNIKLKLKWFADVLFPEFRFLVYAGWGWWLAKWPGRILLPSHRHLHGLDPLYSALAIDGFGFAEGFLRRPTQVQSLSCPFKDQTLSRLWTQGYGRSLWFTTNGAADRLTRELRNASPQMRSELEMGMGLATAFITFDRQRSLPRPRRAMAPEERAAFNQGVAFGLLARRNGAPAYFDAWKQTLPASDRAWVEQALTLSSTPPDMPAKEPAVRYVAWQDRLRRKLRDF